MWEALIAPIAAIINKLIPDKAQAAATQAQLQLLATQGQLQEELAQLQSVTAAQSDINRVEAASTSVFVAGWRPFIGWVCGAAFAEQFLVGPFVTWLCAALGHPGTFPTLDASTLMTLTMGMLGMGGMRTFEKLKGVQGH